MPSQNDYIERFIVGFLSALLIPFAKYTLSNKDGVQFGFEFFIGAIIPFIGLGVLIGLYAMIVEKDQRDMKVLFKICIGLPAMLLTLGNTDMSTTAMAQEKRLVCDKTSPVVQGIISTFDKLTNSNRTRYWKLSRVEESNEYILVDDKKYWVIDHRNDLPKNGLIFDVLNCKLLEDKS